MKNNNICETKFRPNFSFSDSLFLFKKEKGMVMCFENA